MSQSAQNADRPLLLFPGSSLSLFQGHDLHGLTVERHRVIDACGDGRHGDLHGPVSMGEAGHYRLVHADRDRDLDHTWGGGTQMLGFRLTAALLTCRWDGCMPSRDQHLFYPSSWNKGLKN